MPVETPSDRDYCCLHCGSWKCSDVNALCSNCGISLNPELGFSPFKVNGLTADRYVGRGFYGATYHATNKIGKEFAVKVIPTVLYSNYNKNFDEEVSRYRELGRHPNIAELHDAGTTTITIQQRQSDVFFFVSEWIDGATLTSFLSHHALTVEEMYSAILDLCSGVARFEERNLWHNDLNGENILIAELSEEELETRAVDSRFILKIIDIGSATFRHAGGRRITDDLRMIAHHIHAMRQCVLKTGEEFPRTDRFFLDKVEPVISGILDEHSRVTARAKSALEEIKSLYNQRFRLAQEVSAVTLDDPFAYLNANDLPSESYVAQLFSDHFPWLRQVLAPDPQAVLITGPRGCGKTMILKSMYLRTRMMPVSPNETGDQIRNRLERDELAGFFVSARISIGNNCPLTKLPAWAEGPLVPFYLNLLYAHNIADCLHFGSLHARFSLTRSQEQEFCQFLSKLLGIVPCSSFPALLSRLERVQLAVLSSTYNGHPNESAAGPSFLSQVSAFLKERIEFFQNKTILFLLDDFSLPRVPLEIQQLLLPTIWNTGGGYSFRVSAHSESIANVDAASSSYVAGREYSEVNIGSYYLTTITQEGAGSLRDSLEDVLRRRFQASATHRDLDLAGLLGAGMDSEQSISRLIAQLSSERKLRSLRYSGWPTLVKLCSGDISYVIDLLRRISSGSDLRNPISKDVQNREIRRYARDELYRLQDYDVEGCNLFEIALCFGKLSRYFVEHETIGEPPRPAEYLRIEVELTNMTEGGRRAICQLLRHGVFVDGGFSSSSKGNPARRLLFRRMFTPAFPTTFVSRDTLPMTARNFLNFVENPALYLRGELGRYGVPPEQQSLFQDRLVEPLPEPENGHGE